MDRRRQQLIVLTLAIGLALPFLMAQDYNQTFRRRAGSLACDGFAEEFAGDESNFTEEVGLGSVTSGVYRIQNTVAATTWLRYTTGMGACSAKQSCRIMHATYENRSQVGCVFRATGSTGDRYAVWWNGQGNPASTRLVKWSRYSGATFQEHVQQDTDGPDASCTDVDLPWDCCTGSGTGTCVGPFTGYTAAADWYFCATIELTGDSTVTHVWHGLAADLTCDTDADANNWGTGETAYIGTMTANPTTAVDSGGYIGVFLYQNNSTIVDFDHWLGDEW